MIRRLVPLAVLLAAGLAGCGEDEADAPQDDAAPSSSSSAAPAAGETGAPSAPSAPSADAVIAEVSSVAPTLESFYRGAPYPQSVEEAVASLVDADVTLAAGTEVGGYVYDPDAVEFTLCLQDADGAWASYDTAPMGVRDSGTSGGCP